MITSTTYGFECMMFKSQNVRLAGLALSLVLSSCSGEVGGFQGASRKDKPEETPEDPEKKTDEPAEVAGAFLSCVVGVTDSVVQPGQTGVGCGVYSPDGNKLVAPTLVFRGQILDAGRAPINVSSRTPGPSEEYHYIASVSRDTIATGWAGMRVEKMGTNQRRDFEPVLLSRAQSFSDCAPNCGLRAAAPSDQGSWALYGIVPAGGSKQVAVKLDAGLAVLGSGSTAPEVAASLKTSMTSFATATVGYVDKSGTLSRTPDWIGKENSCSTIEGPLPFRDFGKTAVYSVRMLHEKDPTTGKLLHLLVVVNKGDRYVNDLAALTSPSTHPVCAAVLSESAAVSGFGGNSLKQ